MEEKKNYNNFSKKIKEIKKALEKTKKEMEIFEENYNLVKEHSKEREEERNDNNK